MRVCRSSLGWLSMATCYAAEANAQAMKGPATVDIVQWLLGLTAVLISLFVFAFFLRRMGHFSRLESGRFRVLAALSLGSRERVVLVQAGAKQLVLGVAPGSVRTLCVLEGEDAIRLEDGANFQQTFTQQLATFLPGRKS